MPHGRVVAKTADACRKPHWRNTRKLQLEDEHARYGLKVWYYDPRASEILHRHRMAFDEAYRLDHPDDTFNEMAAGYRTPAERTSDGEGVPSPTGDAGDEAEYEDASPVATGD